MSQANSLFVAKRKRMFTKEENADIEIHTDGKIFKVVKTMLALDSPVFRAMFEHDTEEKRTNIVNINGHDQNVVEKFLLYFYIGHVEKLDEIANEMFVLADRYQVDDLRQISLEAMFANVAIENVLDCLKNSVMFQLDDLKQKAVDFIKENFYSVVNSNDWPQLDDTCKGVLLESVSRQLPTAETGELLTLDNGEDLLVIVGNIAKREYHYNGLCRNYYYEGSIILENKGKKRLAYKIGSNTYSTFEPHEGFILPENECTVKIDGKSVSGDAFVIYEVNDKENINECFKPESLVRQVPFKMDKTNSFL